MEEEGRNHPVANTGPLGTGPRAVMIVGPLPPPSGGMANQTRQLAKLLAGDRFTVEVVQVNAPYRPAFVGRVKGLRALFRAAPYLVRLFQAAGRADVIHLMANSGWAWHFFAAPAVWVGWLRGVPVVVNYRGGEAERFFARQFRWVRPTLARAAAVVVPSGFLERVFERNGIPTTIVPNIVDLTLFAPAQEPPDTPHILVTRNLEPIYDIATALRAFAQVRAAIPDARMTIAGSGPSLEELLQLAQELGIADAVSFAGRIDNARLPELYRSATIALNPSLADNMPISLLEAMASGTPIVSTNVGGIPFLVENNVSALLVDPGQPGAMAAAVVSLCRDPGRRAALARQGLLEAANYSWNNVRARLYAVYTHACSQRATRGAVSNSEAG
jgi:glycosyltransferase involved in cell wall biosynthesis